MRNRLYHGWVGDRRSHRSLERINPEGRRFKLFCPREAGVVLEALTCRTAVAIAVVLLFLSPYAVAQQEDTAAGYQFSLKPEGGRCIVTFRGREHSGQLTVAPEPPCEFARSESGRLKYFKYDDVAIEAVLIVIGNPLTDAEKRSWK